MDEYIDDDRDYMFNPETHFIGYKCPFFLCDTIMVDHDFCRATRMRLDWVAGERIFISTNEFLDMFKWNFDQFLIKSPTALSFL